MIVDMLIRIRNRYHPLFYFRRYRLLQVVIRLFDIPVAIGFPGIRHKVYVSLSKNLSWVLSAGGAGEERERVNFGRLVALARPEVFFDVGANVGLYSFLFRSLVPGGSVTMFEPDPANAKLIKKTINNEFLDDLRLETVAVSDKCAVLDFFSDPLTGATGSLKAGQDGQFFVTRHHASAPKILKVQTRTLDEVCQTARPPDFIKIDVEGAELDVLKGAIGILLNGSPMIFFECSAMARDVAAFLQDFGYILFDFRDLRRIAEPVHNNLALHRIRHVKVIQTLALQPDGASDVIL